MNGYFVSVAAVSVLVSVVQTILPRGTFRRIASFVSGLLLIVVVLTPIIQLKPNAMTKLITDTFFLAERVEQTAQTDSWEQMAAIIKEQCETYISDKAETLGLSLEIEVGLREDDLFPYPDSVTLRGYYTEQQRSLLTKTIETNLGISARRQEWISM